MKFQTQFKSYCSDYYGFVSPGLLVQEINEYISVCYDEEGVDIHRLISELGATWMTGQTVVEMVSNLKVSEPVEIELSRHEQHGPATVRRAIVRTKDREIMRYTNKMLPVSYQRRKVLPPSALEPLWKIPAAPKGEEIGWVVPPENMELVEHFPVRHSLCDFNGHMTMYQYCNLVCDVAGYWGERMHMLERVQTDYKRECLPGEVIDIYRGEKDGVIYVSGFHADGNVAFNASVKLSKEETVSVKDRIDRKTAEKDPADNQK